ncbi:hypothetical protein D3C84_352710 [compost metagenome]
MPGAADLVIDHQAIGQRRTVVGTDPADRMDTVIHSHQQDGASIDVAGEHASGRHTGQGHAFGQIGTGGGGIGLSHGATPLEWEIHLPCSRFARTAWLLLAVAALAGR